MLCALNGYQREVEPDDAVALMIGVAAVDFDEAAVTERLNERLHASE
jgi:prophage maintenance system killer protein